MKNSETFLMDLAETESDTKQNEPKANAKSIVCVVYLVVFFVWFEFVVWF